MKLLLVFNFAYIWFPFGPNLHKTVIYVYAPDVIIQSNYAKLVNQGHKLKSKKTEKRIQFKLYLKWVAVGT